MSTNELQTILSDTVTRLFTDRVSQPLQEAAEKGQWPAALWQAVEESGLTLPQVPEARGGGGGSWQDAYIVVSAAGRFAVPLPLPLAIDAPAVVVPPSEVAVATALAAAVSEGMPSSATSACR